MQDQSKQCEQCGLEFTRPPNRSAKQWDRMRFHSVPCANRWRALNCEGSGAQFVASPDHAAKVLVGMAASPHFRKQWDRAARRRLRQQRKRDARAAERNLRDQQQLWPRLCVDCNNPVEKWQRRCEDCAGVRRRKQRKAWNTAHPHYHQLYKRAYARLRTEAEGTCTNRQAQARYDFYGGCCAYCHVPLGPFDAKPRPWHWDHVIPLSKGGTAWPANLRPSCAHCNQRKCATPLEQWVGEAL
jgi:hypothetical protein